MYCKPSKHARLGYCMQQHNSSRTTGGGGCMQAKYVRALKGLALPRASHSGEIALSGSRRLRSTLAAARILFAHTVVTVAKNSTPTTPTQDNSSKATNQRRKPQGVHARKGPHASHSGGIRLSTDIALSSVPRLRQRQSFSRMLLSQK